MIPLSPVPCFSLPTNEARMYRLSTAAQIFEKMKRKKKIRHVHVRKCVHEEGALAGCLSVL